ncbi:MULTISPECIES: VIT family protein [Pseudoxanthomonas]|uniref:VIT1/CCC1 family predicted Fe2+/Mn2+ transporter n=1 Tax=Pseudoxanthomonas winnipegensis TaxID=2480810 RepID=A0AAW8GGI6_9GAMM|nr:MULTISPECIES: VIT family protein [Pseudoxanthomonas]MDQ1121367.1 VIT1/CCC1 family predicted Fe2+/Mn2+ transporter [Pseudoxanthomonas winnipegensis]MDQ1134601.1 VIT1/CCC1 family predicted Fe2+/Mn2+ transporter [Pseudoxanthomonas winnipegensis]MDR6139169.1 VIT1/CCC1 family predicted Fe2+/Mn2+ transporter [Pseudoxanthomonas sp. SORGH_AS_0997]
MRKFHAEVHRSNRTGWLRAAVLGANDGIVSVAGLMVGVAASGAGQGALVATGVAGLVAGAMSMAAGEYVSVSSQADTERADLRLEKRELAEDPHNELIELAGIYEQRGLEPALARQVAEQLTAHDALAAHARDELGITEALRARPVQAALASAAAFSTGAVLPLLAALLFPAQARLAVIVATLLALLASGALAARAGGASTLRGALRVTFWGALAMAAADLVGRAFDVSPSGLGG